MGVSSIKNTEEKAPDPNAPSSVVVSSGLSEGKVSTPLKLPKLSESQESASAPVPARTEPSPQTPAPNVPKPSQTPAPKPQTSEMKRPTGASNTWDSGNLNSSGIGMLPATDSLMMRAGDVLDPVTGLPIRAFKQKPKSKLPLLVAGALLVAVGGIVYYTYTRPEPPVSLAVTDQLSSAEGGPFELTVDTSKGVGVEAIKIKGVEAKPEQNVAKVAIPDDAVTVGKSQLPAEVKIKGGWREATPIDVVRPARVKVSLDKAKEILTFDFEVMEGGTEVELFGKKAKVEKGKARLEMPFRVATTAADQGAKEIEKEAPFNIAGIEGESVFTFKFPAPKPPFVLVSPKTDYTSVEKKTDKLPVEFEIPQDAKASVIVNKEPVTPEGGKYSAPLKPEENIIEIKVEVPEIKDPIVTTLHVFRGQPPENWGKKDQKPKDKDAKNP